MKPLPLLLGSLLLGIRLAAAPTTPANVVYKPTFLTGTSALTAGTGYIAKIDNEYVLLTAHHLFGPAAGLENDLSPQEAKDYVAALAACSMNDRAKVVVSSEMLLIASAKAFAQGDTTHDIAAFRLPGYQGSSLAIAQAPPAPGDKIYLLARPRDETELRLISAVVRRSAQNVLEYIFDESGINFGGTSGAPLLNEAGEVVGLNLGGGQRGGKAFGFANPAAAFAPLVAETLHAGK